jgi:hypothetical protein
MSSSKIATSKDGVKIDLFQDQSITSAANTNYVTVQSLAPANTGEFTSLAALYDEVIVDGFNIQYSFGTGVAANAGIYAGVLAYDPVESAPLGSILNGVQHAQHSYFTMVVAGNASVGTLCHAPRGVIKWNIRMNRSSARNQNDALVFGHDWSNVGGASSAIYGYLKPYLTALPAAGTFLVSILTTFHCRFRCRT